MSNQKNSGIEFIPKKETRTKVLFSGHENLIYFYFYEAFFLRVPESPSPR